MFTSESFLFVCKQAGLTPEEMGEMTIGDCLDYIQEFVDSHKKQEGKKASIRRAGQDDFDNF